MSRMSSRLTSAAGHLTVAVMSRDDGNPSLLCLSPHHEQEKNGHTRTTGQHHPTPARPSGASQVGIGHRPEGSRQLLPLNPAEERGRKLWPTAVPFLTAGAPRQLKHLDTGSEGGHTATHSPRNQKPPSSKRNLKSLTNEPQT